LENYISQAAESLRS